MFSLFDESGVDGHAVPDVALELLDSRVRAGYVGIRGGFSWCWHREVHPFDMCVCVFVCGQHVFESGLFRFIQGWSRGGRTRRRQTLVGDTPAPPSCRHPRERTGQTPCC